MIWQIMCSDIFQSEQELMEEGYDHALHAAEQIIDGEITAAMNEYNRKKKEEK